MTEHKYWTDETKRERVTCPGCGKKLAAVRSGRLRAHRARANGPRCNWSGALPAGDEPNQTEVTQ